MAAYPDKIKKLVYCTRTVVEMEKTIKEVQFVIKSRKKEYFNDLLKFLVVGLSTRKNLCIHPVVSAYETRDKVDAGCR